VGQISLFFVAYYRHLGVKFHYNITLFDQILKLGVLYPFPFADQGQIWHVTVYQQSNSVLFLDKFRHCHPVRQKTTAVPQLVHDQVTIIFAVSVCLFVCAEFFSAVFDSILIKLGHMLYVWV